MLTKIWYVPLQNCGQHTLAYLTAASNGMEEEAEDIKTNNIPPDTILPSVPQVG